MGVTKDLGREGGVSARFGQDSARDGRKPGQGAFAVIDAMRCVLAVAVAFPHAWYLLIEDYRG